MIGYNSPAGIERVENVNISIGNVRRRRCRHRSALMQRATCRAHSFSRPPNETTKPYSLARPPHAANWHIWLVRRVRRLDFYFHARCGTDELLVFIKMYKSGAIRLNYDQSAQISEWKFIYGINQHIKVVIFIKLDTFYFLKQKNNT